MKIYTGRNIPYLLATIVADLLLNPSRLALRVLDIALGGSYDALRPTQQLDRVALALP